MLIKIAYLRYAVCGCCLCIKNANCYKKTKRGRCVQPLRHGFAVPPPLSREDFGMAESPISSPEAPLGRGAVERSETERLLLQRPLIFCYLLFFSFRLFGLLLLTQLFDALFLALDARPWPRKALVLFAPAGERIERESQPEQVQQDVQQA